MNGAPGQKQSDHTNLAQDFVNSILQLELKFQNAAILQVVVSIRVAREEGVQSHQHKIEEINESLRDLSNIASVPEEHFHRKSTPM